MCEPAYSKNNLNFRLVFYRNLTLLLELVLNILYLPLGPTRGKMCSQMTHSRIPDFKDLSTVTTVTDHQSNRYTGAGIVFDTRDYCSMQGLKITSENAL